MKKSSTQNSYQPPPVLRFKARLILLYLTCGALLTSGVTSGVTHADTHNSQDPKLTQNQVGNIILSQTGIATVVRSALVKAFSGNQQGNEVTLDLGVRNFTVPKPQFTGVLDEVIDLLGLNQSLTLRLNQVLVKMNFPVQDLQFRSTLIKANQFRVEAFWQTSSFKLIAKNNSLTVPSGLFPTPFNIDLNQVSLGIVGKTPLQLKITGILDVTPQGAQLRVEKVSSNLDGTPSSAQLDFNIGELSVDQKPFNLSIETPHYKFQADTRSLQDTLYKNKTQLLNYIYQEIIGALVDMPKTLNVLLKDALQQKPLFTEVSIDQLKPEQGSDLEKLAHGLSLQFYPTFLQSPIKTSGQLPRVSIQFGSKALVGGKALPISFSAQPFAASDLNAIQPNSDFSILVHEAWVKNIVQSNTFQSRLKTWYAENSKNQGAQISQHGIGVHFNYDKNAIIVVLNLAIDIKKANKPDDGFWKKLKRKIGDVIEKYYGTGELVYVPLEITVQPTGWVDLGQGQYELVLKTQLPTLQNAAEVQNTYHYPTNIDKMTKVVQKEFMNSLREDVRESVPPTIRVPVKKIDLFHLVGLEPQSVSFTPNQGLLINLQGVGL